MGLPSSLVPEQVALVLDSVVNVPTSRAWPMRTSHWPSSAVSGGGLRPRGSHLFPDSYTGLAASNRQEVSKRGAGEAERRGRE